jgi:hypothetical protein
MAPLCRSFSKRILPHATCGGATVSIAAALATSLKQRGKMPRKGDKKRAGAAATTPSGGVTARDGVTNEPAASQQARRAATQRVGARGNGRASSISGGGSLLLPATTPVKPAPLSGPRFDFTSPLQLTDGDDVRGGTRSGAETNTDMKPVQMSAVNCRGSSANNSSNSGNNNNNNMAMEVVPPLFGDLSGDGFDNDSDYADLSSVGAGMLSEVLRWLTGGVIEEGDEDEDDGDDDDDDDEGEGDGEDRNARDDRSVNGGGDDEQYPEAEAEASTATGVLSRQAQDSRAADVDPEEAASRQQLTALAQERWQQRRLSVASQLSVLLEDHGVEDRRDPSDAAAVDDGGREAPAVEGVWTDLMEVPVTAVVAAGVDATTSNTTASTTAAARGVVPPRRLSLGLATADGNADARRGSDAASSAASLAPREPWRTPLSLAADSDAAASMSGADTASCAWFTESGVVDASVTCVRADAGLDDSAVTSPSHTRHSRDMSVTWASDAGVGSCRDAEEQEAATRAWASSAGRRTPPSRDGGDALSWNMGRHSLPVDLRHMHVIDGSSHAGGNAMPPPRRLARRLSPFLDDASDAAALAQRRASLSSAAGGVRSVSAIPVIGGGAGDADTARSGKHGGATSAPVPRLHLPASGGNKGFQPYSGRTPQRTTGVTVGVLLAASHATGAAAAAAGGRSGSNGSVPMTLPRPATAPQPSSAVADAIASGALAMDADTAAAAIAALSARSRPINSSSTPFLMAVRDDRRRLSLEADVVQRVFGSGSNGAMRSLASGGGRASLLPGGGPTTVPDRRRSVPVPGSGSVQRVGRAAGYRSVGPRSDAASGDVASSYSAAALRSSPIVPRGRISATPSPSPSFDAAADAPGCVPQQPTSSAASSASASARTSPVPLIDSGRAGSSVHTGRQALPVSRVTARGLDAMPTASTTAHALPCTVPTRRVSNAAPRDGKSRAAKGTAAETQRSGVVPVLHDHDDVGNWLH